MKQLFFSLSALLILAACGSASATLTTDLNFKRENPNIRAQLLVASQRVAERMAYAFEEEIPEISMKNTDAVPRMTVKLQEEPTAEILLQQLNMPLDFHIMLRTKEWQEPDISIEKFGDFTKTGLTEESLEWVTAEETPGSTAQITIDFTEEGKELLQKTFAENVGETIGLFVRGGLVSTYQIVEDGLKNNIVISGVPSVELARIFTDDVNVGTHVTFTPVP